jgi:hypothetical protein
MANVPETFPCRSLPDNGVAPGLAEEAGADGTAASALDAAGLFSRLREQPAEAGEGG